MNESAIWANGHHNESAQILGKYTNQLPDQINGVVRVAYSEKSKLNPEMIQPDIDLAAKYGIIKNVFPARELISDAAL